jgi:hypothetical protein
VSKDRTTGGEIELVLGEIRVPQMMGHRLVPVVRLGDKQVRIARRLADRGRPGRVAGIGDDLGAQGQPQDESRCAAGVASLERVGPDPATVAERPGLSSTTSTSNRRRTWDEPGNMHCIASVSRRLVPAGPATTRGLERRENCPSRIRNGSPPK